MQNFQAKITNSHSSLVLGEEGAGEGGRGRDLQGESI